MRRSSAIWAPTRQATEDDPPRGTAVERRPWVQVSRLGNPLINEVIIPLGRRTTGTPRSPGDAQFEQYYLNPELAAVVNLVYPALADADTTGRTDLSLDPAQGRAAA